MTLWFWNIRSGRTRRDAMKWSGPAIRQKKSDPGSLLFLRAIGSQSSAIMIFRMMRDPVPAAAILRTVRVPVSAAAIWPAIRALMPVMATGNPAEGAAGVLRRAETRAAKRLLPRRSGTLSVSWIRMIRRQRSRRWCWNMEFPLNFRRRFWSRQPDFPPARVRGTSQAVSI